MSNVLTLAVCSLKGGVGKTSVTLGLASAALAKDIPTLVVDLDPQADATAGLDVMKIRTKLTDVLAEPRRRVVEEAVVASGWTPDSTGHLDVMGGGSRLAGVDGADLDPDHLAALTTALGKLPHRYRLILIDCPPNLGGLTRMGLAVADRALIVAEPGMFSISAADRALRQVDDIRRRWAPDLQPLGILINRLRAQSSEHQYRVKELQRLFGPLVLPVQLKERTTLQQAQGAAMPIGQWRDPGAGQLQHQFEDILDRALRSTRIKKRAKK